MDTKWYEVKRPVNNSVIGFPGAYLLGDDLSSREHTFLNNWIIDK